MENNYLVIQFLQMKTKEIYKYLSSPEDKNEIRIVIDKVTWEELPNEPESLAEVGRELVFDEVIKLKK